MDKIGYMYGKRNSIGICRLDDVLELYRKEMSCEKMLSCYNDIKRQVQQQMITIDNVFDIIKIVMEYVEQSSKFDTGIERKQYAIAIFKLMSLDGEPLSKEVRQNLSQLINTNMIDDVIELLIQVSRGELQINKRKWCRFF